MIYTPPFRLIAIVLIVALAVMVATPEKADAMEPLTIIAIIGAAAVVVVLIAFLVIANKEGDRADHGPIYMACNGVDCLALAMQAASSYGEVSSLTVVSVSPTQGP
jgi:heme/copper-type cytochrome/quinol oxidase subunit 4